MWRPARPLQCARGLGYWLTIAIHITLAISRALLSLNTILTVIAFVMYVPMYVVLHVCASVYLYATPSSPLHARAILCGDPSPGTEPIERVEQAYSGVAGGSEAPALPFG